MEKRRDQQTLSEPKTQVVEQIKICLDSGDYSRALDLLRGAATEFPNDAELSELEKLAHDGVKRIAAANRLITESQELFAQRKSAEAIQLLRDAYELDKKNSLARSILANALVEQAHSLVETDWLAAEALTNQALSLIPAHPTAKTILDLIVDWKTKSSAEDWIAQARKLQSAGDLFAALAWVAEGLAVHPHDAKLLQIQDEIQRDQGTRRRQNRRRDLEDLRRMELEIDGAADGARKQALAERIQAMAAKYWTDGEILSIANGFLRRLGLDPQESSIASPQKGAAVILHVPRPSAPKPARADASPIPPSPVTASPVGAGDIPTALVPPKEVPPSDVSASNVPQSQMPQNEVQPSPASPTPVPQSAVPQGGPGPVPPKPIPSENAPTVVVPPSEALLRIPLRGKLRTAPPKPQPSAPAATVPAIEPIVTTAKVTPPSSPPKQVTRSNSNTLILVFATAAAIIVVAAILFFARKHPPMSIANTTLATPAATTPAVSAPAASGPAVSGPAVSAAAASAPSEPAPALSAPTASVQTSPAQGTEPSSPTLPASSDSGKVTVDQPPTESGHEAGSLLVVAGQDDAKVFLNGRLQPQHTQAGQLSLTNLVHGDYVVQVSKNGFEDPPQQTIRIRRGEQARLIFNLQPNPQPQPQPQPRLASLNIQGGTPGTTVLVDQTPIGTIQPDGTLSVTTVNPGDHTVELRKERFQPRQFKEHFVAGGAISLAAGDAALEAVPGELKITFAPSDAKVAIVSGELLKIVSSGVPLSLAAGTYTLQARTADRFTRWSTLEVVAGQSKTLDLSLAPSGMSKWDDLGAWKPEKGSFICKGGDFVLYGVAPASGTFVFSAMLTKGHVLQWVLNYTDPKNYVLFQMDDENFYRAVIRNGVKSDEIKVPAKGDKKSFRTLQIHVSPTELIHQINRGNSVTVLDRWTQPGANLSLGKFGFYIPGNDEVALSSFAYYADLNIR